MPKRDHRIGCKCEACEYPEFQADDMCECGHIYYMHDIQGCKFRRDQKQGKGHLPACSCKKFVLAKRAK